MSDIEIKVNFKKGWYGRFRKLKLYVDDEHMLDIKQGDTKVIKFSSNSKEMYGKMDWGETNKLSLEEDK